MNAEESPAVAPRRGLRFEHARMKQGRIGTKIDDCPPEVCRVTRVTSTTVYYRTADGEGTRYRTSPERFAESVGCVLPDR